MGWKPNIYSFQRRKKKEQGYLKRVVNILNSDTNLRELLETIIVLLNDISINIKEEHKNSWLDIMATRRFQIFVLQSKDLASL